MYLAPLTLLFLSKVVITVILFFWGYVQGKGILLEEKGLKVEIIFQPYKGFLFFLSP
jgi:hypothetical protein